MPLGDYVTTEDSCSCPAYLYRAGPCKHIDQLREIKARAKGSEMTETAMEKTTQVAASDHGRGDNRRRPLQACCPKSGWHTTGGCASRSG